MHFERLHPDHYPRLKPYFERTRPELSPYSLSSLIAWRDCEDFVVDFAIHEESVIVRALNPKLPKESHLILPVPDEGFDPRTLHALCVSLDLRRVWYVPETYLARHGRGAVGRSFEILAQEDFSDYLYRTVDLAELRGGRYAKKRNLIRQFEDAYLQKERVQVEPITRRVAAECREFLDRWCQEHDCEEQASPLLSCELKAVEHTLEDLDRLDVEGLLVRIDGVVSGFGIAARLNPQTGVLHYEKALTAHKGLYQYLDRECARRLFAGRYELVNKESDLGMEGLRQAKRSYHPMGRVKCFELRPK